MLLACVRAQTRPTLAYPQSGGTQGLVAETYQRHRVQRDRGYERVGLGDLSAPAGPTEWGVRQGWSQRLTSASGSGGMGGTKGLVV